MLLSSKIIRYYASTKLKKFTFIDVCFDRCCSASVCELCCGAQCFRACRPTPAAAAAAAAADNMPLTGNPDFRPRQLHLPDPRSCKLSPFLCQHDCHSALLQEPFCLHDTILPDDQPYVFDGPNGSRGRDVGLLYHPESSLSRIPAVRDQTDIQWRLVRERGNVS